MLLRKKLKLTGKNIFLELNMDTILADKINKYLMIQDMIKNLKLVSEEEIKDFLIKNFFKEIKPDIDSDSEEEVNSEDCPHSETYPDIQTGVSVCVLCGSFIDYTPVAPYAIGSVMSEQKQVGEEGNIAQKITEGVTYDEQDIIKKLELLNEIYPNTDMDLKIIMDKYREYKTFLSRKNVKDNAILFVAIEPYVERLSDNITSNQLKKLLKIKDKQISIVKGPLRLS